MDKNQYIFLGIVLYEMVTGVVPFEGDSAISVALKHIQEQVTPPGEINPDILKSVQYIIQRAIEKDIENRYHDAEEMLNDLNRALDEPDGAYVKRVSNDDQATRIIPRLSGLDEQNSGKENHGALPDEEGALDKRRGWALVTFSVIAAAAVLLVLFMVVRTIYNQNFASRETRVPRIEGQDEVAAREILKERGLLLTIEEWIYDDTVPEGRIISQNPQEGTTVKPTVRCTLL